MAERIRISDLDFVYISYAEPNKEQNWADLKNKVPWAKRVDGVKGFDSAHKAAMEGQEQHQRTGLWQWWSSGMVKGHLPKHEDTRKCRNRRK